MLVKISPERKIFLDNFVHYTLFQASKYVVPFVTVPYIIYVLGVEKFGIISLAQGVANYIRVGVDYGWNIQGVQYIALEAENSKAQSKIVSTILVQQMLLSVAGLLILFLGLLFIPKYSTNAYVFITAFGLVPGNMLLMPWFFVGMQKVKFLNRSFLIARLLYVVAILFFLKSLNQMIWVPIFNSASLIFAGLINLYVVQKRFGLHFIIPTLQDLLRYFREGWDIFVSYFSTNFYRNSNVIILGFFTSDYLLGIYSLAEKIITVIQGTFMPLSQTLFPYIAKFSAESINKAIPVIKKVATVMGLLSLLMVFLLMISAPSLVQLFLKKGSPEAVFLLRLGSSVIFFGVMNFVIGILFMTNFGMKKQFSNSVFWTGIVAISLSLVLSYSFQAKGAMFSFSFAEFFLFILLSFQSVRFVKALKYE